ncbi:MAG: hypothetical protein CML67_06650 [Rhodobacteraceae bacterium]|nr:hypothetical protein [Paracoccaceae bacterium]
MSDKNRNTTQTDPEAARLPATFQGLTAIITQLSIDVANERGARAVAESKNAVLQQRIEEMEKERESSGREKQGAKS